MFLTDLFAAGGIVMYPLLGFSILAIALIIERCLFWSKVNRQQRRIVRDVLADYQNGSDNVLPKLKQNSDLPIARIFMEALEMDYAPPQAFHNFLEGAIQAELPLLRRFNTVFDTIVAASPLLGLLGTVTGLIQSFANLDLGSVGQEGTARVTGGISEALISTATGLIVALVVLMFSNVFRGFYRRQLALIQEYTNQLEALHFCRYQERRTENSAELIRVGE
ncbi:MAG: MotA/TolQ/ExbB proton channel family protein [Timaviella obliquedivisa GSE-PSE-MK23-08B]|jgi:biopolymer transport protein ExbB|nr:MotA/TolQ/ExbB proton channel family protein [Timaviella obliquedivisa GSE-PSE-MK23-08B]